MFFKHNLNATALKNEWLDEMTWLERIGVHWTKEKCEDEARKYTTIAEFRKQSPQAYKYAKAHDWVDSYDFLQKKKRKYTYEDVYEIAKKYTTYVDFRKNEKNIRKNSSP